MQVRTALLLIIACTTFAPQVVQAHDPNLASFYLINDELLEVSLSAGAIQEYIQENHLTNGRDWKASLVNYIHGNIALSSASGQIRLKYWDMATNTHETTVRFKLMVGAQGIFPLDVKINCFKERANQHNLFRAINPDGDVKAVLVAKNGFSAIIEHVNAKPLYGKGLQEAETDLEKGMFVLSTAIMILVLIGALIRKRRRLVM